MLYIILLMFMGLAGLALIPSALFLFENLYGSSEQCNASLVLVGTYSSIV